MIEPKGNKNRVIKSVQRNFTAAIAISVMITPKGWPIIVNLTFAHLRRTVMVDCNLLQNLRDLETMGNITIIFIMKIDTPIPHEMTATKFYVGDEVLAEEIIIEPKILFLLDKALGLTLSTTDYNLIGSAILYWATSELGVDIKIFKQYYITLHVQDYNEDKRKVLVRKRNSDTSYDNVH